MNSVEWGTSAELDTETPGLGFGRAVGSRMGRMSDVRARRLAAGGLLVTFGLVLASLWEPWFTLGKSTGQNDFSRVLGGGRDVGAMTALYQLADPFFLGWSLIGVLGATAVLGRPRVRRTATGLTAAAIAGQTLVVMAVWHDNGVGLFGSLTGMSPNAQGHRAAGIYLVLAALTVVAASMVVAVRGRLLSLFHDDERGMAMVPITPDETADEDSEDSRPRLGSPTVEAAGSLDGVAFDDLDSASLSVESAESPDHRLYMRPQNA